MSSHDSLTALVIVYVSMVGVMMVLWWLDRWTKNASIADVAWCVGLMAAVGWYAWDVPGDLERKIMLLLMVGVYGLRLGLYILLNRVLGTHEDGRYQYLRWTWGRFESHGLFIYFQLQALAVALFSLPFLAIIQNPYPPFSLWELMGLLVWGIAVTGEALADWQLARFRAKPSNQNQVYSDGIWRYSRHPNYFFEWIHWWAYVLIGMNMPGWALTWVGPISMGWTLLKITGIPWAERQALLSRGEKYRVYQRTTSAFVPWFYKTR